MTQAEDLAHELATEQAHVDAVYARLNQATDTARSAARSGANMYRSERDSWLREEAGTALFERDAFSFQAARRLAELDAEHEGLVFGRLDLDDPTEREVRYIGRIGVRDDDYEPLVIDWRARAAEAFYRATPQKPMDVVRRRVLRCRNDRVIGIEDDLLDAQGNTANLPIIGEGALMASLARARGTKMRDIVATIQGEQDEAIRADYQGVTVISGGPGTGKTVVALHRAAYLLYSNRRRFERGGVLVVGPGPVFMHYIERVLPSLGEDSVALRSIGSVVSDVLPEIASDSVDDADTASVKGSLKMIEVLRNLVNLPLDISGDGPRVLVTVKGEVLQLRPPQLARIRGGILAHQRVNLARESARKAAVAALASQVPADTDVEAEEVPGLIADQAAFATFMDAWWPTLTAPQVLRRLGDARVVARAAEGLLDSGQQALLVASYADPEAPWTVADTALLDELVAILGPVPTDPDAEQPIFIEGGKAIPEFVTTSDTWARKAEPELGEDNHETYAHVLVDEAQDVTPMQWRMLRRRGGQASWTVVGDLAQSSWPDLEEVGRAVRDLIGNAPHREFRLSVNYRSPAEVFDLAARVVKPHYPAVDLPRAVRSTGHEPQVLTTSEAALVADLADVIDDLTGEVAGTVGVIAPPSRREALRGALQQRLATRMNPANLDRILFPSPLEAKGLEYDGVVVVDPDAIVAESPGGIRVLYVALTRPTQRLVTLDVGGPGGWRRGVQIPQAPWPERD